MLKITRLHQEFSWSCSLSYLRVHQYLETEGFSVFVLQDSCNMRKRNEQWFCTNLPAMENDLTYQNNNSHIFSLIKQRKIRRLLLTIILIGNIFLPLVVVSVDVVKRLVDLWYYFDYKTLLMITRNAFDTVLSGLEAYSIIHCMLSGDGYRAPSDWHHSI